WCVAWGPREAIVGTARLTQVADQAAQRGELERARATWLELWRRGAQHPGLAARLAWFEMQAGQTGPAALWVLRGDLAEPRDPAPDWVGDRVRESGGLVGAGAPRTPVTRLEWSLMGVLAGLGAGILWPRRRATLACVALALAAGVVYPLQGW